MSLATSSGVLGGGARPSNGFFDGPVSVPNGNILAQSIVGNATVASVTAIGSAFTNQPANDGIEVLSANAGDTTQTVTIIGTTTGTNTVVVETVTLTGTTAVATVKTNWGVVLAVTKSAATLGTVTVREASADATITAALTAAVLSVGVNTVTTTTAFNKVVSVVSDGATTKQIGYQGTNAAGTVIYDSIPLTGATAALSNSAFQTLTAIYTGDVEAARTETVTTGLSGPDYAGTATNDSAQTGKIGELLTAQLAAASTTSLTTATAKDIITISLTAGDWDVSGVVNFVPANTTAVTALVAGISATTATQAGVDSVGGRGALGAIYTSTGNVTSVSTIPVRISLAATTTYYLVATATFSVSTCTGYGTIRARRCR